MRILFPLSIALALVPTLLACTPTIPAAAMQEIQAREASQQAAEIVVIGTNTCLGCDLKGAHGASAQCSLYGHRHGLQVESARIGGQLSNALVGKTLHYLDNDASAELLRGEVAHSQRVEVTGRFFEDERMIEVAGFTILE